jgi:hypothetical protein
MWSLDPTAAGFGWELPNAPVEGILVVESNSGGRSRLEQRPHYETAQELVAALGSVPGEQRESSLTAARVAALCRLADQSACRRLALGDLETASQLVRGCLARA